VDWGDEVAGNIDKFVLVEEGTPLLGAGETRGVNQ
jgi:hypothetical protein